MPYYCNVVVIVVERESGVVCATVEAPMGGERRMTAGGHVRGSARPKSDWGGAIAVVVVT